MRATEEPPGECGTADPVGEEEELKDDEDATMGYVRCPESRENGCLWMVAEPEANVAVNESGHLPGEGAPDLYGAQFGDDCGATHTEDLRELADCGQKLFAERTGTDRDSMS